MSTTAAPANIVSKTLSDAGIAKAGRYSAWGYTADGFIVIKSKYPEPRTTVVFTLKHDLGEAIFTAAVEALTAAGFGVVVGRNNGKGGDYRIEAVMKAVA